MQGKFKQKKTLGLALGGGGVRGLAHIGLLSQLEKSKIRVDAITGTSMGAMVGAIYALGISMETFLKELAKYAPKKYISFRTINIFHESLMKGDDFDRMLQGLFGDKKIEDCKIPFSCTAVDLESGKLINLKEGLLWKAVRASSSLPFILPPVFFQDKLLIDGGVVNNLPLLELREFGTEVVMGSRVNSLEFKQIMSADIYKMYYTPQKEGLLANLEFGLKYHERIKFMLDIILRTLEVAMDDASQYRIVEAKPDLLIEMTVPVGMIEMEKGDAAIEVGKGYMEKYLLTLKKLIS